MPVRKIGNSHRSMTGMVTSVRGNGQHRYESGLERDFFLRLDFNPRVERFEAQPVRIEYEGASGKARSYTPDVLAFHRAGSAHPEAMLYEVKYEAELEEKRARLEPKFVAGRSYAAERGWGFEVRTEKDIRTPFLENARFLRRLAGTPVQIESEEVQRILAVAEALPGEPTPDRIANELSSSGKKHLGREAALRHVWHLLARGHIGADLHSEPLTGAALLSVPSKATATL